MRVGYSLLRAGQPRPARGLLPHIILHHPPPVQASLDQPEALWKAYIDFEISQEEHERSRALYRALLERTKHVKVWVSFAQSEGAVGGIEVAA